MLDLSRAEFTLSEEDALYCLKRRIFPQSPQGLLAVVQFLPRHKFKLLHLMTTLQLTEEKLDVKGYFCSYACQEGVVLEEEGHELRKDGGKLHEGILDEVILHEPLLHSHGLCPSAGLQDYTQLAQVVSVGLH